MEYRQMKGLGEWKNSVFINDLCCFLVQWLWSDSQFPSSKRSTVSESFQESEKDRQGICSNHKHTFSLCN